MSDEEQKPDPKLTDERIECSRKEIAKIINRLEHVEQELKWACELADWNPDVAYQVEEAAAKLGFALATLTNWFDEDVS